MCSAGKALKQEYNHMSRICLSFLVFILSCSSLWAQDDPEYRMEIGGGVGLMTYEGDFNTSILSGGNMSPSATFILRRVINPYSALRFSLGYGKMKGGTKDIATFFPDYNTQEYKESARENYTFSNTLFDFGATYEYNFFPYGTGRDYRGAKRLTPFIALGLGLTYINCPGEWIDLAYNNKMRENGVFGNPETSGSKGVFTANIPLGFGVKYKMAERLNLGIEWMVHFSLSDKLDGVKDPYRINGGGVFKNTDCYSNLQISLTYSFWEKCKTCMNDDY